MLVTFKVIVQTIVFVVINFTNYRVGIFVNNLI